ncbi:hypothetical protein PBY51_018838 [Eleginops maclovinus]|uniref:DNA replication factor Dna2 N-terminal domain-containing protein n=1 Tax=Eleginops maclovinus TaxID=56733 RepID=A0AAN7YB13_ELEMC|nr:hypothetical protein PBY51_018838 [Eleginops maclovinus]
MNRTKLKKTKGPEGQKNILSFFSSQNHQKDLLSPTKLPITALARTEPQIKNGETSTFRPHSPLKRSIFRDLENLQPCSPDLLLSVPETPDSQIKLSDTSSFSDGDRLSPRPSSKAGLEKLGNLSPICRTPRSKGQRARRVMSEEGGKTERENGWSGSVKRIISPPQESHNAKRPRNANPPKPIGPLRTPRCSSNLSEGQSVSYDKRNVLGDQRTHQKERDENEKDTGFTVITEQKAYGNLHAHLDKDTHTLTVHMHTPSVQNISTEMQRSVEPGDLDLTRARATTAALTSNGDNPTSSDQQRAGAENPGVTSSGPVEEMLDDSWFDDLMDNNKDLVIEEKSKRPRKVPDHVILSGGLNNRYWVLDVEEKPGKKLLTITCFKSQHPTETCLLKDGWEITPVCCGDVVHLEGHSDGGSWVVDREQGFLVYYLIASSQVPASQAPSAA